MSAKIWAIRIRGYDEGCAIPKTLISRIKSIFNRNLPETKVLEFVLYDGHGVGWSIEREQTEVGRKWLEQSNVKKYFKNEHIEILKQFDHFTFAGILLKQNVFRREAEIVYRVHAKDGSFFDYTASPWQQGTTNPFNILKTVV